jgi:hypothetical protein
MLAALMFAFTGAVSVATAPSASASASSCTQYARPLGTSYYCAHTNGSGRYVNYVSSGFNTSWVGNRLCNTRVKIEFYDTRGVLYYSRWSSTDWGCKMYGKTHRFNIYKTMRAGHVRHILYADGRRIDAVRHNIR